MLGQINILYYFMVRCIHFTFIHIVNLCIAIKVFVCCELMGYGRFNYYQYSNISCSLLRTFIYFNGSRVFH